MADQIPIKVLLDGSSNTCGLAQFAAGDTVGTVDGGTGLATQGICAFVQPGLYAVSCKVTYLGICAGKADDGNGHDNTYVGYSAGTAVTTGCHHTLIGKDSGIAITTCSGTVAVGLNSANALTFGMYNTYVGTYAGASGVIPDNSTFIGYRSGASNGCSNNTAVGTCTLHVNDRGEDNVAIGVKAGATQVHAGCNNTYIGSQAGEVALCRDNTLVGAYAGTAQTTATCNVMLGGCVGYGVVGGAGNVYLGYKSGLVNTSGNDNVFIGKASGVGSTASCCLIIGNGTCDLITGDFNTGVVGIGTTAACAPLMVVGPDGPTAMGASSDYVLSLNNAGPSIIDLATGTSDYAYLSFSDSTHQRGYILYDHGTSAGQGVDSLSFGTAGVGARMVIDCDGNVGIGTTAAESTLDVRGNVIIGSRSADSTLSLTTSGGAVRGILRTNGTTIELDSDSSIAFFPNNAKAMTLTSSGDLGIGTTTPGNLLELYSAAKPGIRFNATGGCAINWEIYSDCTNGKFTIYNVNCSEVVAEFGHRGETGLYMVSDINYATSGPSIEFENITGADADLAGTIHQYRRASSGTGIDVFYAEIPGGVRD